jgi:hypothetical protein
MPTPAKNKYAKPFVTGNVTVKWSHLMTPDDKFGNPNHSVTVELTTDLQKQLQSSVKELGGKKINGLKEVDGTKTIKFKNVIKAREGIKTFPVLGPDTKPTETIPFGSDVVRVKVTPALISRDNSVSFYMESIQLIERNYQGSANSEFSAVGTSSDDSDVPF